MNVEAFRGLFAYNRWANARVWKCVMALTDAQFFEPSGYSIGSVHRQIVHTMDVESLWLKRLLGFTPTGFLNADDYPIRTMIRAEWDIIDGDWVVYLDKLDEERLASDLEYRSLQNTGAVDRVRVMPTWQVVAHVVNHSTDHRAQTLAQIDRVGGATVAQDMAYYARELRGEIVP